MQYERFFEEVDFQTAYVMVRSKEIIFVESLIWTRPWNVRGKFAKNISQCGVSKRSKQWDYRDEFRNVEYKDECVLIE